MTSSISVGALAAISQGYAANGFIPPAGFTTVSNYASSTFAPTTASSGMFAQVYKGTAVNGVDQYVIAFAGTYPTDQNGSFSCDVRRMAAIAPDSERAVRRPPSAHLCRWVEHAAISICIRCRR